tara:strand:- start:46 stop:294 length:249 start_codon:yes stop_codon:yes gene_type:complete
MIEIYRSRKPIICPSCGFRPVARIEYGLPKDPEFNEYERKLYEEEEAGKVIFGGCIINSDSPTWECSKCNQQIWRSKTIKVS